MEENFGRFFGIKKKLSFLLAVMLVATTFSSYSFAENKKEVLEHDVVFSVGKCSYNLNGKSKAIDIAPFIENGRLMVPISCIADSFEAKTTWNKTEKRVIISKQDSEIAMRIGSKQVFENGKYLRDMSVAPLIKDGKIGGRTMIPLSEAAKLLDIDCSWNANAKTVKLKRNKASKDIISDTSLVYSSKGVYGTEKTEDIDVDVYIKAQDVTLKNMNIKGDLYVCEEVGTGDVNLNNISVSGTLYVNGGGKNSIHVNGGSLEEIVVGKTSSSEVRIVTNGVRPRLTIAKEAQNQSVRLEGGFERVDLNAPNAKIDILGNTLINQIVVSDAAKDTALFISEKTTVENIVANQVIEIDNKGKIKNEIKGEFGKKVKENIAKKASSEASQVGGSGGSTNSSKPSKPVQPMGEWQIEDFIIEGQVIKGFSDKGIEKFKTNKALVLPKVSREGNAILEIGDSAFEGEIATKQNSKFCMNSVEIPDTVTVIGKNAFRYQALTDIKLPNKIKTIKMSAFNGNKLQKLVLPDSLTELEAGAFTLNEISELKLSKGLEIVPTAFGYNKLERLVIPEGIKRIEDLAFSDNDLVEVTLPQSLEYLSGFNNNAFESFTIPSGVKELGKSAIARNKIGKITIPKNVKIIGEGAFRNTWHDKFLTEVVFEEGLEKIERNAFNGNHLTDVMLPDSVVTINDSAFVGNTGYDGVVHLYTKGHINKNNLKDSKHHVINPAKLILLYKNGDEIIKEESFWKDATSSAYFVVGQAYKIKPEFKDALYELENRDELKVVFDDKVKTISLECKAKEVSDKIYLNKVKSVPSIVVDKGTLKDEALKKLEKRTKIIDSRGKEYTVNLDWKLDLYEADKAGTYEAKSSFELPSGVVESSDGIKAELKSFIIVKSEANSSSKWSSEDFIYEGTVVSGFSKSGEAKLASNKEVEFVLKNTNGENITGIAKEAFKSKGITKVVFPKGISNFVIGSAAFEKNEIEYVYFPMGIKEIDTYSFNENKLMYLEIPDSVKKIGNHTFANNQLVDLKFGDNVEGIALDRFSFRNNKLISTTILKQVKKVHGEAFMGNTGYADDGNRVHIFTISFDPNDDNNNWFGASEYHRVISIVDKSSDFEVKDGVIVKYLGTDKDLVIPNIIAGQKVTAIGDKAFYKKGLTSVIIPDSVETIGKVAFGENAILNITMPYELKLIDMNAFAKNQIASIEFGDKLETIGAGAFANNKIKSLELPNSIKEIGSRAFTINEIDTLKLPNQLNEITGFVFCKNKLKTLEIPEGVTVIGSGAFKENALETLVLPESIVKIDCGAFMDNKFTEVNVTDKATEICESAFDEGVKINKIKLETEFWQLDDFVINGKSLEGFSESGNIKLAENKVVKLPSLNKNGEAITEIANKAFSKKKIEAIEIPNSVEVIGVSAFADNALSEIKLPKDLKTIMGAAFAKNKLIAVEFGDSVEAIGAGAFANNQIESLQIPDSVTKLEQQAFLNNKISSLSFSGNIKELNSGVFSKNKLTSLIIPEGIEIIGRTAFSENELETLVLPDSLQKIDFSAFIKNKLTEVTLKAEVLKEDNSFDNNVKINIVGAKEKLEPTLESIPQVEVSSEPEVKLEEPLVQQLVELPSLQEELSQEAALQDVSPQEVA